MDKEVKAISELAQKYFDALYNGDTERFAKILHPKAVLYCNNNDEFVTMTVPEYLKLVATRTNPVDRGDKRRDEVLQIIVSTPTCWLPGKACQQVCIQSADCL